MTEDDWLTCPDPEPMLRFLFRNGASERRLRLFAVACARRASDVFPTDRESDLLDVALLLADGRVTDQDLVRTRRRVAHDPISVLLAAAAQAADEGSVLAARGRGGAGSPAFARERAAQADLLREVFGTPLRPAVLHPDWMRWSGGLVPALARGIYEDRTFHRMGYLADALEEAGGHGEVLEHLRTPGPHFRGCWALEVCMDRPQG